MGVKNKNLHPGSLICLLKSFLMGEFLANGDKYSSDKLITLDHSFHLNIKDTYSCYIAQKPVYRVSWCDDS